MKIDSDTAWKVSKYGGFSGSYFPTFGLNTAIRIQSECGKIWIRKNSVFGCFLCSVIVQVFIIWRLKKSRIFMFSSYYRFVYKGDELIKVSEQWNEVFHIIFVFTPHFLLICLILIYSFALRSLLFFTGTMWQGRMKIPLQIETPF